MIRSDLVSFTTLDVCVLLGLRIGGCVVDLQRESQDSPIRKLFPSTHVYVKMIFDEIQKRRNDVNVDDFCKLYVLLGLSEFLLPTVSGSVFSGLFSIVDDLGELCNYNWGTTVFQFLVQSLYQTLTSLQADVRGGHTYIGGCAYVLQVITMKWLDKNSFMICQLLWFCC